jgi:ribosomal protein L7Ae-like RNA K-turn-binding protein
LKFESINQTRDEKLTTTLQFAFKANKVILGHDACLRMIHKKKVMLIIFASDLSSNSYNSIVTRSTDTTPIVTWGNKNLYYSLFGKLVGIIGILDLNFKNSFLKHFET